tara:strand:- start:49 stop:792 length:744 start_codon:yes stop_codon:yes gene_type:complete
MQGFFAEGYKISNFFNENDIENILKKIIKKINIKSLSSSKDLKKYHEVINDNIHSKISDRKNRYINLDKSILNKISNNNDLKKILLSDWGHTDYSILRIGSLIGKKDSLIKDACVFRVARPFNKFKRDVGGIHFDLNYGGRVNYNLSSFLTIWIPLIGFNDKYSLNVFPNSHKFIHLNKNLANNNKFLSPVFNKSYTKKFKGFRPNLKMGQAIIFNSNLLHGNSFNLGNLSRFSIELRICNNKSFIK